MAGWWSWNRQKTGLHFFYPCKHMSMPFWIGQTNVKHRWRYQVNTWIRGSIPESQVTRGQAKLFGAVGSNPPGSVSTSLSGSSVFMFEMYHPCGVFLLLSFPFFFKLRATFCLQDRMRSFCRREDATLSCGGSRPLEHSSSTAVAFCWSCLFLAGVILLSKSQTQHPIPLLKQLYWNYTKSYFF